MTRQSWPAKVSQDARFLGMAVTLYEERVALWAKCHFFRIFYSGMSHLTQNKQFYDATTRRQ